MRYTRLNKGANLPLLFILYSRTLLLLSILLLSVILTGCRNAPPEPILYATGYLTHDGSTRIWRKDLNLIPQVIISDLIPYSTNAPQVVTTYHYIDGSLSQVERRIEADPSVIEQLRFDENGKMTFNQRVYPARKELIVRTESEQLVYQAEQILQMSEILRVDGITLHQGRYQNGITTTCDGERVALPLTPEQIIWLTRQLNILPFASLAWLEGREKEEVILMTALDICATEPTLASM